MMTTMKAEVKVTLKIWKALTTGRTLRLASAAKTQYFSS